MMLVQTIFEMAPLAFGSRSYATPHSEYNIIAVRSDSGHMTAHRLKENVYNSRDGGHL